MQKQLISDFSTHLHSTLFGLSRVILSVKVLFYLLFLQKNMCADNPCANNATCRSSFTDKLYQCLCPAGYKGPRCQTGKQKNPLYRSSEIFNSIIKKHSSRTLTTWTCVIYIVISKQQKKTKKPKREWKRETHRGK